MRLFLLSFFLILITSSLFGQSSERPQSIVIPISSIGEVSETRQQILQNTLTQELSKHYQILPQDQFERVQEKVFQELDYEECTEDQCIVRIQEVLQIENVFNLQIIGEEGDTQLNLMWMNLDEKRNQTDYCEGCKTRELSKRIIILVKNLLGGYSKKIFQNNNSNYSIDNNQIKSFVTVGNDGIILTSINGINWSKKNKKNYKYLRDVSYGKNLIIMVGYEGTILTFNEKENYINEVKSGSSSYLRGITYGNGVFVTVGRKGTIIISENGDDWKIIESGTTNYLKKIIYKNNLFVSVGENGTILTSVNGTNWGISESGTKEDLNGIYFRDKNLVTIGEDGTILTSQDGFSWVSRESGTTEDLYGITYGKDTFVTVGDDGIILISQDGKTWKTRESDTNDDLQDICFGNDIFVVVGGDGIILTSSDGSSWRERYSTTSNNLRGVTYFESPPSK